MYGIPASVCPTSRTRTTCSLLMRVAAFASRKKRSTLAESRASFGCRNLMAIASPSVTCSAATTAPIPPRPMTRRTR
jgi:hypothetical protein